MAIDNKDVVDLIGIDINTGVCKMTISDHLDWIDSQNHLLNLQDKINSYIDFKESGQIFKDYPSSKNKPITIEIVGKYPIPKEVFTEYFTKFKNALLEYKIDFEWSKFADND